LSPQIACRSDGAQIVGIGLAGSLVRNDVEANFLTFLKIVHPGARDGADVDEICAASVLHDEAKPLLGIKPLYFSGCHIRFLSYAGLHRRTGDAYLDVPKGASCACSKRICVASQANRPKLDWRAFQRSAAKSNRRLLRFFGGFRRASAAIVESAGFERRADIGISPALRLGFGVAIYCPVQPPEDRASDRRNRPRSIAEHFPQLNARRVNVRAS
jgi:hypothetical protein